MDGRFLRSSAVVGVTQITARALGILFSFAVAKLYLPAQFGEVRYLIALSGVLLIPTGALPRTLSRFVAKHRASGQADADRYFSNSIVLLAFSMLPVLAAALVASVLLHRLDVGLFALCIGTAITVVYFDVLRSVERFYALAVFYITANIVQLVIVVAAATLAHVHSVTLVVTAYGLSSIPPLLCIELIRRSPVRLRLHMVSWTVLRELLRFAAPMVLAQAAYTAWFSVDILLVEHYLGVATVANYALSKTVTLVYVLVPLATTTVVLPRFVHTDKRDGVVYLRALLLASLATSLLLLLIVTFAGNPLLQIVFHHKYPTATVTILPLSFGMLLYSVYVVLESWVISIGRPLLHAVSMTTTAAVTIGSDIILLPRQGQLGAGIGFVLGAASGLVLLGACAWITRPRQAVAAPRPSVAGLQQAAPSAEGT